MKTLKDKQKDLQIKISELPSKTPTFQTLNDKKDYLSSKYQLKPINQTPTMEASYPSQALEQHATSADWKKKIDDINSQLASFENTDFASMPTKERNKTVLEYQKKGEQLTKQREEYEAKYRAAKYNEEYPVKYAEYLNLKENNDFEEKSKVSSEKSWFRRSELYDIVNNIDNRRAKALLNINGNRGAESMAALIDRMNDDEIKIFNYIHSTQGKEKAKEYIDFLKQELNFRVGEQIYDNTKDSVVGKQALAAVSGLENFTEGIAGNFDKDRAVTGTQIAASQVRGDLSGIEATAFDLNQTIGNMAPSILLSSATGHLLGAAGLSAKAVQAISGAVGSGSMGLSAAGNAYQEALRQGRTESQARAYSTLIGASEASLQYALGGISKLGGKALGKIAPKISAVDKAAYRIAAKYGSSMASEGIEEALQEVLTPVFESVVYNEKYNAADIEDIAYSAMLGAITGGIFESPEIIGSEMDIRRGNRVTDSLMTSETRNTINDLDKKSDIVKGARNILNYAVKFEVLKSGTTKQAALDAMSEQNITPSSAVMDRIEKATGIHDLHALGLGEDSLANVEATIDKLDTAFAAAWYGTDGIKSARSAAELYTKAASVGDAVGAASIATRINNEAMSDSQAKRFMKKAEKLLPSAYSVDTKTGTNKDIANRIINAAGDYIKSIDERVTDASQNYLSDIVEDMNGAFSEFGAELSQDARSALTDLLTNGNVNRNLNNVLSDPAATEFLSRILGTQIDGDTSIKTVDRKVKNMLASYKSGNGAQYSSVAKTKTAKMNSIELQLKNAELNTKEMLDAFKNAVFNGKLTEKQAKLIASYDDSFNIFVRSTAGRLDYNSTIGDMIDAAALVAGFDISKNPELFYDNGITEVVESESLPADAAGLYDADTGAVVINKNAEPSKQLGYRLARELVTDKKVTNQRIRDDSPNIFNPNGLSLDYELEAILNTAQSFDGRYLYMGELGHELKHIIKKYLPVEDLPVVMNYRDAYLSMESKEKGKYKGKGINYHNIGKDGIKQAISNMNNPDSIILSKNDGKIELSLNVKDYKKRNFLMIIELNTKSNDTRNFKKCHVVTSIYGRRNIEKYIEKAKNEGRLIYQKNEDSSQGISQVQYEGNINEESSSINSIPDSNENVNTLADKVLDYIENYIRDVDSLFSKASKKYKNYVMERRGRLGGLSLSAENINREVAAEYLTELFTNADTIEACAKNDLEFMTEIAEQVKTFADDTNDITLANFANKVYSDMFEVMNKGERARELQAVLTRRRDVGLPTAHLDETSISGITDMSEAEEETLFTKFRKTYDDFNRGFVDSGEAINRLAKKLGNKTIYHLYNNSKQSKQAVNYMLTEKQVDMEGNKLGESLKDIFKPIMKDQAKYKTFCDYMQLLNNSERALHDKAIFKNRSHDDSISQAKLLEAGKPEFKIWAQKVYKYIDGLLKWQLDSGLISYEQLQDLKASNKYYVPALRKSESNTDTPYFEESVVVNKTIQRAEGGAEEGLMPLLDALSLKTNQIINEARMNLLANEIIETLRKKGLLVETPTGYQVADAALQEFVYNVTAIKNSDKFAPQKIDGVYLTPMAQRDLKTSLLDLFEFGIGNKNVGRDLISKYAQEVTLKESYNADSITKLVDKLIDIAVDNSVDSEAPYFQYPELRARLASAKIYVSPDIVNEIPDFNHFKNKAFKKLSLVKEKVDGCIEVDSIYSDLCGDYADLFPADIANPTDQLQQIHKVATETLKKPKQTTFTEYHGKNAENVKNEVKDKIKELSEKAVKDAHFERESIKQDADAHAFVRYDSDSTDNFTFGSEQEGNRMAFYIDGIRYNADVGRGLYEGLKHIDHTPDARRMWIPLQKANSLFKKLVTSYNLFFSIRNFVRDLQDAVMYSSNALKLLKNLPKAYKEIATNGEMWQLYKSLGGVGSSYFDFKAQMDLEADLSAKSKAKQTYQKTVNMVEFLNQAVEQAPRLSEFMSLMENSDGSYASKMRALYGAADVTVNFGRSGIYAKFINSTLVPFFNPGMQGASRFVRMFTETKNIKQWMFLIGKLVTLGFSFGAINDLLNGDDEEYKQLTDYQKQNNVLINIGDGRFIKIPKGRSLSIFSIGAENVMDSIKGEKVDWIGSIKTAAGQIAPNDPFTDNLVAPVISAMNNKTWYGGEIESQADESVKPSQRYDETTDYFSRWIGEVLNISPKKVNYVLDSYSGVLGDYVLPIFTPKGAGNIGENVLLTAGSNFIVDGKSSNRVSSDYYSLIENLTYEKKDINNEDNTASAVAVRFMNSQTEAIRDLYDEIHEINGGNLSPNEKAAKTRELKAIIAGIMLNAMETEKEVYDVATNIESKYAYKFGNTYRDEVGDEITYDRYIDIVTREVNRKVLGAEYALKEYNSDVYQKASEAVQSGATYDLYYDAYFDTKEVEGDIDFTKGTIKTGTQRKNKWAVIDSMDASELEKSEIAKILLDVSNDKLIEANLAGISNYDYIEFISNTGAYSSDDNSTKREKVLKYINKMSLSSRQKDALYRLAGYSEKTIHNAPWH